MPVARDPPVYNLSHFRPPQPSATMGWRVHGCYMILRTLSIIATHLTWIASLVSRCVYFQLWKSYDILWFWIYVVITFIVPKLRYDNFFLQCSFLWRRRCCDGERWRYALKEQDKNIDEEDEKNAKITNAVDLGVTFLRLRVSAAILMGNINLLWSMREGSSKRPTEAWWSTHFVALDWVIFQYSVWLDLGFFWAMLFLTWCRQCRLCCQLGCCRYYLFCVVTVIIGLIMMELPMYYAFKCMDSADAWCSLACMATSGVSNVTTIMKP